MRIAVRLLPWPALTGPRGTGKWAVMTVTITSSGAPAARDTWQSMRRGWSQCCPSCGKGRLFSGYLKVAPVCEACSEELHHQRADDAPPYFTIFIVGHLVIGGVLWMEKAYHPEPWLHAAIWGPITVALSLWLLPRIKGALVGLQWAQRMHGFGGIDPNDPRPVEPPTQS